MGCRPLLVFSIQILDHRTQTAQAWSRLTITHTSSRENPCSQALWELQPLFETKPSVERHLPRLRTEKPFQCKVRLIVDIETLISRTCSAAAVVFFIVLGSFVTIRATSFYDLGVSLRGRPDLDRFIMTPNFWNFSMILWTDALAMLNFPAIAPNERLAQRDKTTCRTHSQ